MDTVDLYFFFDTLTTGIIITLLIGVGAHFMYSPKTQKTYNMVYAWFLFFVVLQELIYSADVILKNAISQYLDLHTIYIVTAIPFLEVYIHALLKHKLTQKECLIRIADQEIPILICIVLSYFGWNIILQIYGICLAIFILLHCHIRLVKYNRNVKNTYSDVSFRDLHWMQNVLFSLILLGVMYIFLVYLMGRWYSLVFSYASLILYVAIGVNASKFREADYETLIPTYQEDNQLLRFIDPKPTTEEAEATEEIKKLSNETLQLIGDKLETTIKGKKLYLDGDLTIKDIAQTIGTNTAYVSYYINKVIGKSFSSFINDLRIIHAEKLLREDVTMSIESVAVSSGFNSLQTMQRLFQSKNNCTPSQYRLGAGTSLAKKEENENKKEELMKEGGLAALRKKTRDTYPKFESNLIMEYQNLTKREVQLCCLLVLGYSSAEIAEVLGINDKTINVMRSRMRSKMRMKRTDNLQAILLRLTE